MLVDCSLLLPRVSPELYGDTNPRSTSDLASVLMFLDVERFCPTFLVRLILSRVVFGLSCKLFSVFFFFERVVAALGCSVPLLGLVGELLPGERDEANAVTSSSFACLLAAAGFRGLVNPERSGSACSSRNSCFTLLSAASCCGASESLCSAWFTDVYLDRIFTCTAISDRPSEDGSDCGCCCAAMPVGWLSSSLSSILTS